MSMPIDFHNDRNRGTYASRTASDSWGEAMRAMVDSSGLVVADIGCGGGIYSRAWSDLGARRVIGIDFSARMIDDAREASATYPMLTFLHSDATTTGLPDASVDIVFERALVHHLSDLDAAFTEARRILQPGGTLIVQDRTMEDVQAPASPEHLRGYFFEVFPRLLDVERERRPNRKAVETAMRRSGFANVTATTLLEPRRTYGSPEELAADLRARAGRSILHALDGDELSRLVDLILDRTGGSFPLEEIDFWTVWSGRAPA
jgi:ubiquinone/menaquinone biosynthesis C-methylase UbiE